MSNRPKMPKAIETELLRLSARRCCLCYGLHQDIDEKKGQIAHLDHDPTNNDIDNLAWLSLEHHDEYDGKTSQSKRYTIQEVKKYRNDLYKIIAAKRIKIFGTELQSKDGEDYYQRFSAAYIGRTENVQYVLDFLINPHKHFMLLYGVGGMGKSHLISECRKKFTDPNLRQTECSRNYNLRSLFKTCGFNYPEELSSEEKIKLFIDEFGKQNIILVLDDFYETIDTEIRGMLPKLAAIPYGKILLVSRAIPKELDRIGFQFEKYLLPPLDEPDFNEVIQRYIALEKKNVTLNATDLRKIFDKAQGYPLGGQLIIDLLFLEEKLDDILKDLPKFETELDENEDEIGKRFSGRLLDNIFRKGSEKEIMLLCEFSALFDASSKELIKQLPSFNLSAFEILVNRRRFIYKDENGNFNCHAMIKDYAYEKLNNKSRVHNIIGKYFEKELFTSHDLKPALLESAIQHYKLVSINELQRLGRLVDRKFDIRNVKSLIEENVKDTIRNYKNLLEIYPFNMHYYNELGIAYRLNNQKELAIKTFLKAIEINPTHLSPYNSLGITYRESNQTQLAIKTFLNAIEINPKDLPSYNELGITYRKNKQTQLAIDTFLKAIEIDPKNLPPYNALGITYRENNQTQLAIETFLKAIEINPKHLPSYNELGITYRENNQTQLAIETFQKAIELAPENLPSYNELGITYRKNNQTQLAIETFLKAIEIGPEDLPSFNALGITYKENNQTKLASETFQKAIEIDPKHLPSYNELSIAYRENNQCDEAIKISEKALEVNFKHVPSLLNLLQVFVFFQPDKQKATQFLNRINALPEGGFFDRKARKKYTILIENLEDLLSFSFSSFKEYEKYVFLAIHFNAYHSILPILFKLNEKFPDNLKIVSRLGKTLSNQVIARNKEGWGYLKQAITLYKEAWISETDEIKKANFRKLYDDYVFYYFNNLLCNGQKETLKTEMINYQNDIRGIPEFHPFFARHFEFLEKSAEEVMSSSDKTFSV
jgi:tetratricopeptide (TPR) repeat protein